VPGSQGTNSVRGTWSSEGEAGRHLRTKAGQIGATPVGQETPSYLPIALRLERIATQAREYPDMAFTTLAHHLDVAMLERAFQRLNPKSAAGVDRVTWRRYKENLEANLETLHDKLVTETYSPQAVVRRLIPKGGGKFRPLGLAALEDKIVAKAVGMLLESIYEQDFYDFSHGFRPGRSPHLALHEVRQGLFGSRIGHVIDCDISSFFDNLQHDTLLAILRKRVKDGRVLKLIETWLKAGILDGKEMVYPDKGSPQGSVISPLLANVYLARGAGHVVRDGGESPLPRASGFVALRGRCAHRLRVGIGCSADHGGTTETVCQVWAGDQRGEDQAGRLRSPAATDRRSQIRDFQLSGLCPLLGQDLERHLYHQTEDGGQAALPHPGRVLAMVPGQPPPSPAGTIRGIVCEAAWLLPVLRHTV